MHCFGAVASVVVLQTYAGFTRWVVHDEEGDAELGCIRFESIYGNRLPFVLIVGDDAHLIGEKYFGGEVVVGSDTCKRVCLVLQGLVEVLAGLVEEFKDCLFSYLGTQCQRIDEHTYRIADAQVGTSVADGGDAQLFVVGKT